MDFFHSKFMSTTFCSTGKKKKIMPLYLATKLGPTRAGGAKESTSDEGFINGLPPVLRFLKGQLRQVQLVRQSLSKLKRNVNNPDESCPFPAHADSFSPHTSDGQEARRTQEITALSRTHTRPSSCLDSDIKRPQT